MKIYIFYINNIKEGDISISQVYAENFFEALDSLILISNCDENDIEFMGYEPTCKPDQWKFNQIIF